MKKMSLSVRLATLLFIIDHAHTAELPEIIKEPETQYVLTGENATFECHTTVKSGIEDDAHWELNRVPITLSFEKKKQEYEEQGVIFKEDISQEHYNLTMIIPASLDFNNTDITCVAIAPDFTRIFSRNVNIFVFDTLRPYQPSILIVEVIYSELQPIIHIALSEPPRWPGYEISQFRMNITKLDDSSLLHQISTANITENNTVDIYEPLQSFMMHCSSLMVSASAVSSLYGESEFSQYYHSTPIFKAPGIFPENGLNLTTFHYFNGSPFPLLQVKLPDICTNQPVNYTFIIETEENDTAIVILEGPYFHIGPGLVPHCVNGLHKYRNYSIFVQVNSIAGSSESDKLYFDTYNRNAVTQPELLYDDQTIETFPVRIGNKCIKKESDTSSVAMGIMIALLSLVLLIVCIIFLLFCAYYHYVFNQIAQNKKKIDAEYNMVPRPEPTYVNATPVPEPLYVNTAGRDHDQ